MCKLPAKKSVANRCLQRRESILDDIKLADPNKSTDLAMKMNQIFDAWRNTTVIRVLSDAIHSQMLVILIDIVDVIGEHLKSISGKLVTARTRGGSRTINPEEQLT